MEAKTGLNGFQLKFLALVFMTLDHIYYYLGDTLPVPYAFTLIGRLAAPIFIFLSAQGFRHTRSRKKYMTRLYLFSVGMGILNIFLNTFIIGPGEPAARGNIFATIFYIIYFLSCVDLILSHGTGKIIAGTAAFAAPFLIQTYSALSAGSVRLPWFASAFISVFVPLPFSVEGGIILIAMGVSMYFAGNNKDVLSIVFAAFSALYLPSAAAYGFLSSCQWAMIFALPLLLSYNGEKGKGMKYLFYFYYPLHIFVLAVAANI